MKGKNVLITGGTGFVGSHVVEKFLEIGANVFVTYREINPRNYFFSQKLNEKVVLVSCDIKDKERVHDVVSKYEIDVIIHLAAQALVTVAYTYPYETLMSNIQGTINILESAKACGEKVQSIVVFSSDKAYGMSDKLPYNEEDQLKGLFPYDCSKSCTDLIAQMYAKTYDLPICIVRSGNIFGPGDLNFNRIIPGAMEALIQDKELEIRSDGKMIREYVYVKDVANACAMMAEHIGKVRGEACNLGSKNIFSVLELLDEIEKALGAKINRRILNKAKAEIPKQHLDFKKIQNCIGWENKVSLVSAIKETYDWYKKVI